MAEAANVNRIPVVIACSVLMGISTLGGGWFVWNTFASSDASVALGDVEEAAESARRDSSPTVDLSLLSQTDSDNVSPEDLAEATPAESTPALAVTAVGVSSSNVLLTKAGDNRLSEMIRPFLTTHCADCHSGDEPEAGIRVDTLTSEQVLLENRGHWERIYRMINAGAMPPRDYEPLPGDKDRKAVADWLEDKLFNFDCRIVNDPGRPTIRRLNKSEYNNTIRDLFGIDIRPADEFPSDDVGEGFDNIGDVLTLPPLLMEKYLNAAEDVADAVIDNRGRHVVPRQEWKGDDLKSSLDDNHKLGEYRLLTTNGSLFIDTEVVVPGEYTIEVEAAATQAGDDLARMAFIADDRQVQEVDIQGHKKNRTYRHRVTLEPGTRRIGVAFLNDHVQADASDPDRRDRNLGVSMLALIAPRLVNVEHSAAHQRFVISAPGDGKSVPEAATEVLRPFLRRAFRRPVSDTEVSRLASAVEAAAAESDGTYESGLHLAIQAALVSPYFLFRVESDPDPNDAGSQHALTDHELASRLSYFLWSSMPDDTLLDLADQHQLHDPATLKLQVLRMLQDERSVALVDNFASQWLNLRNLDEIKPDPKVFPDFNSELQVAMRRETELLFETIMREDRSVMDFIDARYTFVNKTLAEHYGIPGVRDDAFVRVSLEGQPRAGVLTHASILTLTSNPGRTSPVKRGKWIMENLFGEAPPPPPPDVPQLEVTAEASPDLSLREQLAIHRLDPGCAACHQMMDPLGLGLENFDAIGRWRTADGKHPIDASGKLPSGETFNGPEELIRIVKTRQDKFCRTTTERLMTYALGRGLRYYDKCAVDNIVVDMKNSNDRFSSMVIGIVTSKPFLTRRGESEEGAAER